MSGIVIGAIIFVVLILIIGGVVSYMMVSASNQAAVDAANAAQAQADASAQAAADAQQVAKQAAIDKAAADARAAQLTTPVNGQVPVNNPVVQVAVQSAADAAAAKAAADAAAAAAAAKAASDLAAANDAKLIAANCSKCGDGFYSCPTARVSTYRMPQYDPIAPGLNIGGVPVYFRDGWHSCDPTEESKLRAAGCSYCSKGFYECGAGKPRVSTYRLPQYDPVTPPLNFGGVPVYFRDGNGGTCA